MMLRLSNAQKLSRVSMHKAVVVSGYWWKKQKASSSSEFIQRLALACRRVKEDDAYGKG